MQLTGLMFRPYNSSILLCDALYFFAIPAIKMTLKRTLSLLYSNNFLYVQLPLAAQTGTMLAKLENNRPMQQCPEPDVYFSFKTINMKPRQVLLVAMSPIPFTLALAKRNLR